MSAKLTNRVALVAGGTGGLGRSVSLAFLAEGATVVVTYRKPEELDALRVDAGLNAGKLEGQRVDVTDEAAVRALVDGIVTTHGSLDALVNTVGAFAGGGKLWEQDAKTLDQMLTPNLRSGWVLSRAAVPVMLKQRRGSIVNIASRAAVVHEAGVSAYAAAKAAALALMDSLAAEVKGTGLRVNSVLPSIIDTPANRKAMPKADFTVWPKPDDIAKVVLFLCSDEGRLIHGAAIPVYGDT